MPYNRRRPRRRSSPAESRPESQVDVSPSSPAQSLTPTWAGHSTGSINMSQPQCGVSAPSDGGTVLNVTVNHDNREYTPRTNARVLHESVKADHEIYSSQLLVQKRGFPLWVPGPGMHLPIEYRREGISIGDVGIITANGEFDFLFNIFHPADHAINDGMVPQGFSPLPCQIPRNIQRPVVYGPNTYLTSSSARRTSVDQLSGLSIEQRFESTSKEAAILVMPGGATTQNLLNTWVVRYTVERKASEWYTYARFTCGRDVKNGDIRVVIGVDKVSSWGIATSACNTGQSASYVFKPDPTHTYMWECIGGSGRVGPQIIEIDGLREGNAVPENQCVFVRTINFTLSGKMWNNFPSEAVERLGPGSGKFGHRDSASGGNRHNSRGGHGGSGGRTSSGHQPASIQGSLQCNQSVHFEPVELGVNHPSDALHKCLHEKFPGADMVITEDMDWISVLNDDDVDFPEPGELCARVLEAYELHDDSAAPGIVRLLRKDLRPSSGMEPGKDMAVQEGTTQGASPKAAGVSSPVLKVGNIQEKVTESKRNRVDDPPREAEDQDYTQMRRVGDMLRGPIEGVSEPKRRSKSRPIHNVPNYNVPQPIRSRRFDDKLVMTGTSSTAESGPFVPKGSQPMDNERDAEPKVDPEALPRYQRYKPPGCFRKLYLTRYACGHTKFQREEKIDCGSPNCRMSASHNPLCPPETCAQTCLLWMHPPQRHVDASTEDCDHCRLERP